MDKNIPGRPVSEKGRFSGDFFGVTAGEPTDTAGMDQWEEWEGGEGLRRDGRSDKGMSYRSS